MEVFKNILYALQVPLLFPSHKVHLGSAFWKSVGDKRTSLPPTLHPRRPLGLGCLKLWSVLGGAGQHRLWNQTAQVESLVSVTAYLCDLGKSYLTALYLSFLVFKKGVIEGVAS